ncbi:4'-phosphopantetheinyl transferase superfamily protein [Streptomyces capitiformicae]|uniref:4'-phosphopantetheinyl transferase domain-containing protein n=1 Tax=Streptomyces capitiformicae TaxID=2014920 RepID=A0A918Z0X1_9ACTN|nr:4'-phosphopantetheinyl transferase superfamily protein [Streptomyces capitiformicae]GHE33082.1 hypothetical protein GCM10017771_50080 [Streptomyces capitiformicae]
MGVDVQGVPGPETVTLCAPALHPAEQAEIAGAPESLRPVAFARLWARKEAYLKGLGTGIGHGVGARYLGERGGDTAPARPAGWDIRSRADPRGAPWCSGLVD